MTLFDFVVGEQTGGLKFAQCPFCGSDMFVCNEADFVCFKCGRKGDLADFLATKNKTSRTLAEWQLNHEDHKEILEALKIADMYYRKRLKPNHPYVCKRGLDEKAIEKYHLGWADGKLGSHLSKEGISCSVAQIAGLIRPDGQDVFFNRLMIPIMDRRGRVLGFGGRITKNVSAPKYINSAESPVFHKKECLFGIQNLNPKRTVYIVEGYMDAISLQLNGVNSVAVLGTAVGSGHALLLSSLGIKKVVISLDSDGAGVKNAIKAIDALSRDFEVKVLCEYDGCKDPDEFVHKKNGRFESLPTYSLEQFLVKSGVSPVDIL